MDIEYRKHYRDLFQRHWWWRARSEFVLDSLEHLLRGAPRLNILDVGCGEGLFFESLSKFGDVEGVELESALPPDSPWRNRIHCRPVDETFQPGKQYSLILMLDVLEHLADTTSVLQNVRRLLAPDGFLVITVPAFQSAWTNHDILNQHVRRYTKKSLRPLLERCGFRVSQERYFFHWTFLAKLGVRAYERVFPRQPQVPTIPADWINESLYRFSRLEQSLLGRLPMPFGSSLMIVARAEVGSQCEA